jgi:hypothetical protein
MDMTEMDAAPAPEVDANQTTEDQTAGVDSAVLDRARSSGFSDDDIGAIGAANLPFVFRAVDREMASRAASEQPGVNGVGQPQQQQQQIDAAQFAAQLNLNPDDIDEKVIGALKSVNDHYANQSMQMIAAIGELVNRFQGVNNTVDGMVFDNHLSALGEDWHPVFGAPNARNAREIERFKNHVGEMRKLTGTADFGEAFQRGLGSLYLGRLRELERKKLNADAQRGMNRVSERPASRETEPAASGIDKALERVRRAKREEMGG